ncbi:hypothetical protein HJFPF1_00809 [Paramyrothecium foliicola]|nr:hypothetical protein HJFPF1_00809 [Paramyrothecium foliicola]
MRFTISATAILAMAMSAFAQTADFNPVYTPEMNAVVEAGSTFKITWEAPAKYAEGTISISLIGGATQGTQVPLQQIAAGIPNSAETYSWAVDATLGKDAVYGLVVRYESNPEIFQYSNPFSIKPAAEVPAESTSSAAELPATTVTTQHGAVTVTLSSCTTSTTPVVTPTSAPVVSSTPVHTFTSAPAHNTTFSTVKPVVPSTSATVVVPPVASPPAPAPPAETPISGAGRVVSGGLVIVGGVMAMLAL